MTEEITFHESAGSEANREPPTLRARLGPIGYTVTLATIVLAFLALGAGVSVLVKTLRRPPIVSPAHGAIYSPDRCPIVAVRSSVKERREMA